MFIRLSHCQTPPSHSRLCAATDCEVAYIITYLSICSNTHLLNYNVNETFYQWRHLGIASMSCSEVDKKTGCVLSRCQVVQLPNDTYDDTLPENILLQLGIF